MSTLSVLVCDDVSRRGNEAVRGIQRVVGDTVNVHTLFGEKLGKEIAGFYEHTVNPIMKSGKGSKSLFDEYDIVFLDSNLSEVHLAGFRLTAAAIVGYIRAFSSAKYIVTINRFPLRDFDLSLLSPSGGTLADLAINTKHLSSRWLWFREREMDHDFCPWYWPTLSEAPKRRARQLTDLKNLNSRVLEFFSFPKEAVGGLTNAACAQLDPITRNTGVVTFLDFYEKACSSLVPGEKQQLSNVGNLSAVRRIVSAELEAWLYRHVLAPQAILVDVPHLLSRIPVVLGRKAAVMEAWNGAMMIGRSPYGMSGSYYTEFLKERLFTLAHWFAVPVFWWGPVRNDRELDAKLMAMDSGRLTDFRFCEDISQFLDGDLEGSRSFNADFQSTFNRRHVRRLRGVRYGPVENLLD